MCEETQPFGDDVAVYKVGGRIFACVAFDRPEFIALKCNPERAVLLRDRYSAVTPAWHFNKRHWNDLQINDMDDSIVAREIRHSYMTVVKNNVTPKKLREEILELVSQAGVTDADIEDI